MCKFESRFFGEPRAGPSFFSCRGTKGEGREKKLVATPVGKTVVKKKKNRSELKTKLDKQITNR